MICAEGSTKTAFPPTSAMPPVRVTFEVSVKDAKHGDKVFVVGDIPELGNWQTADAKELTTGPGKFPRWQTEVEIESASFEYKYVWQHFNGGPPEWESIANRTCESGTSCKDGEFNQNECSEAMLFRVFKSYLNGYFAQTSWALQQFANKAELAALRSTIDSQAKDLADHRKMATQQEALLVQHQELVREQRAAMESLQAALETQKAELEAQKKNTERLRRELSDFRAKAPEAEEIQEEILKKLREDFSDLCSPSCNRGTDAPPEATFHDLLEVEEFTDLNDAIAMAEVPSEVPPPRQAAAPQMPLNGPEKMTSADVSFSRWNECSGVKFTYPPPPEKEEDRRLTEDVLEMLMSNWTATKEEKAKLLKKAANLRLHSDKGGSDEAMKWFNAWKSYYEKWYLEGGRS